jgi:BASS family bile acid:Na+ symporter
MHTAIILARRLTGGFPFLAILLSVLAFYLPGPWIAAKPAIVPLLGLVMFGMGLTLTAESFAAVLRRPGVIGLGVALQFLLMPLLAWSIGRSLELPPQVLAGLVLVGACPGGTASNVICYLARGDVALSITLTTLSTFAAVLLTPALTWLYVGQSVPVPIWAMLLSVLKIVIAPVLLGLLINRWLGSRLGSVKEVFPAISVLAIVVIIAIIVALNHDQLAKIGPAAVVAVMLHNLAGLATGYWLPSLFGVDRRTRRTLAIEVGMQNSGLGVALAVKYFSAAAALPGAVFSIWHNLSGATLAAFWLKSAADGQASRPL